MEVEWEPPLNPNGIVGYQLYQWTSLPVNPTPDNGKLIYDGTENHYFIYHMHSNITLYFQIVPYNIKYNLFGNRSHIINGSNFVSGNIL